MPAPAALRDQSSAGRRAAPAAESAPRAGEGSMPALVPHTQGLAAGHGACTDFGGGDEELLLVVRALRVARRRCTP